MNVPSDKVLFERMDGPELAEASVLETQELFASLRELFATRGEAWELREATNGDSIEGDGVRCMSIFEHQNVAAEERFDVRVADGDWSIHIPDWFPGLDWSGEFDLPVKIRKSGDSRDKALKVTLKMGSAADEYTVGGFEIEIEGAMIASVGEGGDGAFQMTGPTGMESGQAKLLAKDVVLKVLEFLGKFQDSFGEHQAWLDENKPLADEIRGAKSREAILARVGNVLG